MMIGVLNVDQREPLGIAAHVEAILDERDGVGILAGSGVHTPIVDAHAPLPVMLRDEHDWGGPGRVGGSDEVLLEELLHILLDGCLLGWGQSIGRLLDRSRVSEVDGMFDTRSRRWRAWRCGGEGMESLLQGGTK